MQRNTVLFLVLSLGILVGWQLLTNWLHPPGKLKAVAAEGVSLEGVKVAVTAEGEKAAFWEAGTRPEVAIRKGKYTLAISAGGDDLALEPTTIEVAEGGEAEVRFIKKPPAKVAEKGPGEKEAGPGTVAQGIGAKRAGNPPEPGNVAVAEAAAVAPAPRRRITLGSGNEHGPGQPYRMLVTLDSHGASVERVELNSERYHDQEDPAGYLGRLAAESAPGGAGAIVGVVGPGTPAEEAGLLGPTWELREVAGEKAWERVAWDQITAFNGEAITTAEALEIALAATKPGQEAKLDVLRHRPAKPSEPRGPPEKMTFTVKLEPAPFQVLRPELENSRLRTRLDTDKVAAGQDDPLSFLLTLRKLEDKSLPEDEKELPQIDLKQANWDVLPADPKQPGVVAFRRALPAVGLEVTKRYRLAEVSPADAPPVEGAAPDAKYPAAYHLTLEVEVKNTKADATQSVALQLDGPTGLPIEGWWYNRAGLRDYALGTRRTNGYVAHTSTKCYKISHGDKEFADGIRMADNEPEPVAYVGVDSQYFASVILPHEEDQVAGTRWLAVGKLDQERFNRTNISCRLATKEVVIPAGGQVTRSFTLFAGPKENEVIQQYGLEAYFRDGSWMWPPIYNFITKPLQWILHFFHSLVHNYGIAIVMLTILVRLCMFRLSLKQARSAVKMQELQPEIKRLQEQHPKDVEARNKAMAELFRKHNYHPLAGCLPMLVQMPIFIGLYWSLAMDIELRQTPLIPGMSWCANLAAPDMLSNWSAWMPAFLQRGWTIIPTLGPYFNVLPLVTIVLFLWQQKKMMSAPMNEQAAMQMKIMQYMMIYMTLMFYLVPSGLCIYFIASSLWGLAERKFLPKPATAGTPANGTATFLAPPGKNGDPRPRPQRRRRHKKKD